MQMEITALYAALLGLLLIGLSFAVSKNCIRAQVSLGDGNDPALGQAIRSQGNFIEYVPFALILLGLVEATGSSALVVHLLGVSLLLSRLLHAWGMSRPKAISNGRKLGIILNWLMIVAASVILLASVLL